MFKSSLEPYRGNSPELGPKGKRRHHARCYSCCFAGFVVARIYRIPRDVRSDPSAARDRSRLVCGAFPDRPKRCRLGKKPMIGLSAAIVVCAMGLIALFAFASLYLDLYRYVNQLAKRLAQDGPSQGVSELEGSLVV